MTSLGNAPTLALWMLTLFALGGCSGKLEGMSETDLQDKIYECNSATSQSPGFAISCDNYRRECKRRREEGRFVC